MPLSGICHHLSDVFDLGLATKDKLSPKWLYKGPISRLKGPDCPNVPLFNKGFSEYPGFHKHILSIRFMPDCMENGNNPMLTC